MEGEQSTEVKILGTKPKPILFHSREDFNNYYSMHKSDIDSMTTQQINKKFAIEGFHIVRRDTLDLEGKKQQGTICLKPLKPVRKRADGEHVSTRVTNSVKELESEFRSKFAELDSKIQTLTSVMNQLIEFVNSKES